jgi:hypothetical protein
MRLSQTILRNAREGGVNVQDFGNLQEGASEELDPAIDTIVWFPELRT